MAWYGESLRHSKAAMGIKTGKKDAKKGLAFKQAQERQPAQYPPFPRIMPMRVTPGDLGITIRNNSDVAKAFAAGATTGKRKHLFIEGNEIYSYGYHFPIAKIFENQDGSEQIAYFNTDRYSVTTAKHKSLVRGALESRGIRIIESNTKEIRNLEG